MNESRTIKSSRALDPETGQVISAAEWRARHLPGVPFKVTRDPEVRKFVDEALKTMGFRQIAEAARARFGERAPGWSAICRYLRASGLVSGHSRNLPEHSERAKVTADILIQEIVATEARLQRILQLCISTRNPAKFMSRIPRLVEDARRAWESVRQRVAQVESIGDVQTKTEHVEISASQD